MYRLTDEDHLDLWKYFQGRADDIKQAMFTTLTWTLGLASGLLGVIFVSVTTLDQEKSAIGLGELMVSAALSGLAICSYAWLALSESARHIQGNWKRADRSRANIEGLTDILAAGGPQAPPIKIWVQLRIVVALYVIAFLAVLSWVVWT
jgi:hypothetical protein